MKNLINIPKMEGNSSRQAHADLPNGTFEREMSKEGFFGPSAHIYHRNPPTGWIDWDGPLRPRAFNLNKMSQNVDCPWNSVELLFNELRTSCTQDSTEAVAACIAGRVRTSAVLVHSTAVSWLHPDPRPVVHWFSTSLQRAQPPPRRRADALRLTR